MRQIRSDGICGLFERAESVNVAEHELADAGAAALFEPRHHVDQHQSCHLVRSGPIRDEDSGQPAHACPDQHCWPADGIEHMHDVSGQCLDVVVGVGRPIAITVAAAVDRDHVESFVGQHLAGFLPGKPILAAAMQHEDRRPVGHRVGAAIPLVSNQRDSVEAGMINSARSAAHGSHGRPFPG
jgi:hypothetical protein